MVARQLINILKYVLNTYIHKLHPDKEQTLMLITQIFFLGENRDRDLWLSSQGL